MKSSILGRHARRLLALIAVIAMLVTVSPGSVSAHDPAGEQSEALKGRLYDGHVESPTEGGVPLEPVSDAKCVNGVAAGLFPCHNVNLMSFMPLPQLESTFINDVWGWQDPATKMEIAIAGTFEGTVFVDVTDGYNPVYLGMLPSAVPGDFGNIWGDIRVYENTAYIGSEAIDFETFSGYGVQIVDLTQFRGATGPIAVAQAGHIDDMTNSHNLSLNTDSGRLYVAGSVIAVQECQVEVPEGAPPFFNGNGGSIVYDVSSNPTEPEFIGCLTQDDYTHDIQCVIYHGPDKAYRGHEICVGSNEDAVTVYDATDMSAPSILATVQYQDFSYAPDEPGQAPNYYTHQGWLSEDHSFFFLSDELDEYSSGFPRTTYIWDFTDLDNISVLNNYSDGNSSIDHNMFVHQQRLYQSNYTSGLWIYDTWLADEGALDMRGYFDVFPADDRTDFFGTWGNYPYFGQGKVIVTSSDEGLFVLDAKKAQNRAGGKGKGKAPGNR